MIKRSALTFIFSTAMVFGVGSAAGAQDDCSVSPLADSCVPAAVPSGPTEETPGVLSSPVATPVETAAVANTPLSAQTLPVTGSETAALALGGTLLVAAGGALVWRSNKAAA